MQYLLLLLAAVCLQASHVQWVSHYDSARREALHTQKKLMVLLVQKDHPRSQESIRTLFMNRPYIKQIHTHFVPVLLVAHQKQSYPVEMLYTDTYPSLFFLDAHELFTCKPLRGVLTVERIEQRLRQCR